MARMLDDILDFARSHLGGGLPTYPARVDLHEVCRGALEELRVAYPDRRLELEVEGNGVGCWDADRMTQVVGNLVVNALQHGRAHTPVRVTVRDAGDAVLLSVHNQGEPIPSESRDALFLPFRRGAPGATSPRGSVGLGLYIVQQVALAHGGEVTVHSAAEEGTTFTMRLPRQPPSA
jgi:signal transduction histidine kinase